MTDQPIQPTYQRWQIVDQPEFTWVATESSPELKALGITPSIYQVGRTVAVTVRLKIYVPPGAPFPDVNAAQRRLLEAINDDQ